MSEILAVSKELIGLGTTLAKSRKERRDSLAEYLTHIAECIQKIAQAAADVERDASHWDLCAELSNYAASSTDIFQKMLSPAKAAELEKELKKAVFARKLSFELESGSKDSILKDFGEAVGNLRATANILRAPAPVFQKVSERRSFRQWVWQVWRLLIGGQ